MEEEALRVQLEEAEEKKKRLEIYKEKKRLEKQVFGINKCLYCH